MTDNAYVEEDVDQITNYPERTNSLDPLITPETLEENEKKREQNYKVLLLMIFVGECLRLMLDIYFFLVVIHEKPHFSDQIWDVALCFAGLLPLCYSLTSNPGRALSLLLFMGISQITPLARFKHLIFGWIINNKADHSLPRILKFSVVVILFAYYISGIVVISMYLWFMLKQWRKRCVIFRTEINSAA